MGLKGARDGDGGQKEERRRDLQGEERGAARLDEKGLAARQRDPQGHSG